MPDAAAVFLYRNCIGVVDSACAAFFDTALLSLIRGLRLDCLYLYHLTSLKQHLIKFMPVLSDTERFPQSCYEQLGAVSGPLMSWISAMTDAEKAYKAGL